MASNNSIVKKEIKIDDMTIKVIKCVFVLTANPYWNEDDILNLIV